VIAAIRAQLATILPSGLVDELLGTYTEAKRNFYLGGHRLAEVEGGRFAKQLFDCSNT
jgi:hypothetical protein